MDQPDELVERVASLEARVAALESKIVANTAFPPAQDESAAAGIIQVQVTNKRYDAGEYQPHVLFDCVFTPVGLTRATRAVKGLLEFCDLFGAPRFVIGYVLNDRLEPGKSLNQQGIGFEFNQFISDHQWMLGTKLDDMTVRFRVDQILYEDGAAETMA